MGWQGDLLADLAQLLEDTGVGTWKPSGLYDPADPTPIVITSVPATPDRVVTLSGYGISDDPSLSDSVIGVQVRCRGTADPRTADETADAVFDAWHGLTDRTLPSGLRLVELVRISFTPLGTDGNRRHERSDNYRATAHRPSTHRT